jgi:hypothetical protein
MADQSNKVTVPEGSVVAFFHRGPLTRELAEDVLRRVDARLAANKKEWTEFGADVARTLHGAEVRIKNPPTER